MVLRFVFIMSFRVVMKNKIKHKLHEFVLI